MNLQDITDFIDVVKNPAKYEAILQRFKEEQDRLNAAIETVGKASELDKLRKQVEKEASANAKALEDKIKKVDEEAERRFVAISSAQAAADNAQDEANKVLQEAAQLKESAVNLQKSFEGRDKALRQAEEAVKQQQEQVAKTIEEYNERLSKLRSVMA